MLIMTDFSNDAHFNNGDDDDVAHMCNEEVISIR